MDTNWFSWIETGWAFLLAILGWVWHAGRLAYKVDALEKRIEQHMKDEEIIWKENRDAHKSLVEETREVQEKLILKIEKLMDKIYEN